MIGKYYLELFKYQKMLSGILNHPLVSKFI